MFEAWGRFLQQKSNRRFLFILLLLAFITIPGVYYTLAYAETRSGYTIETELSGHLPAPRDFSEWIFFPTYGFVLIFIAFHVQHPKVLAQTAMAYLLLQIFRILTLLSVPLSPPDNIIPLTDPILERSFYNGSQYVQDLFFSGHAGTLMLLTLLSSHRWVRYAGVLVFGLVGVLLILQRVHYVSDVIAAPFFAWLSFRVSRVLFSTISPESSDT